MRRRTGSLSLAVGVTLLLLELVAGLWAPRIAPDRPEAQDLGRRLEAPTAGHPLGRDALGRDVLSRLLHGARISLPLALAVVGVSATAGTLLGASVGYLGGAVDALLMAAADLLLAFPGFLLAVAFVAVRGPGIRTLFMALCLIGWVGFARLARGEARRLRSLPFVEAARALGANSAAVVGRHVVPGLLGPATVQASLGVGAVILAEAGLSFLGLGVPPPVPTWGAMLREGTQNLLDAPRLTLGPGLAIFTTVLAAQFLGEGVRRMAGGGTRTTRRDRAGGGGF